MWVAAGEQNFIFCSAKAHQVHANYWNRITVICLCILLRVIKIFINLLCIDPLMARMPQDNIEFYEKNWIINAMHSVRYGWTGFWKK